MLTRAHIKNVLSCTDVLLDDLPYMTALVGRNAVGKSNIMRAIEWTAQTAVSPKPIEMSDPMVEHGRLDANVALEFKAGEATYRYELNLTQPSFAMKENTVETVPPRIRESLEFAGGGRWYVIFERSGETIQISSRQDLQIGALTSALSAIEALLSQDDELLKNTQPAFNFLRRVHYYPLDEPNVVKDPRFFVSHADYVQWQAEQSRSANAAPSVAMQLVHMSQAMPTEFDELKQLVGDQGLSILSDITIEPFVLPLQKETPETVRQNTFYFLNFLPTDQRKHRTYKDLSFGTRRQLQILVSMLFDKSSVMLIEQPEDGIHPGLLHKLIPLLKSYTNPAQVILASHSPIVFNRLTPQEIRLVEMRDGATTVRALTADEVVGAQRYISEDGPLSDYIETIQENG